MTKAVLVTRTMLDRRSAFNGAGPVNPFVAVIARGSTLASSCFGAASDIAKHW